MVAGLEGGGGKRLKTREVMWSKDSRTSMMDVVSVQYKDQFSTLHLICSPKRQTGFFLFYIVILFIFSLLVWQLFYLILL